MQAASGRTSAGLHRPRFLQGGAWSRQYRGRLPNIRGWRSRTHPRMPSPLAASAIDKREPSSWKNRRTPTSTTVSETKADPLGFAITGRCQTHCCLWPRQRPIRASYLQASRHLVGGVDSVDQVNLAFLEPAVLQDGVASQCRIWRVVDDGQALLGPAACHVEQTAGAVRTGLSAGGLVFKVSL